MELWSPRPLMPSPQHPPEGDRRVPVCHCRFGDRRGIRPGRPSPRPRGLEFMVREPPDLLFPALPEHGYGEENHRRREVPRSCRSPGIASRSGRTVRITARDADRRSRRPLYVWSGSRQQGYLSSTARVTWKTIKEVCNRTRHERTGQKQTCGHIRGDENGEGRTDPFPPPPITC